jgi:thymidine kinase
MFSSKTTTLLTKLERAYIAKKNVVLLRPTTDSRGFLSHSNRKLEFIPEIFVEDLLVADVSSYDVVGIDEGQFHKHLKDFCIRESLKGKHIYISALHATSESVMFEQIIETLPYCDDIIKFNAICTKCGSEYGNYSFYKGSGKIEKVVVGGTNEYTALCQKCYFKEMSAKIKE